MKRTLFYVLGAACIVWCLLLSFWMGVALLEAF